MFRFLILCVLLCALTTLASTDAQGRFNRARGLLGKGKKGKASKGKAKASKGKAGSNGQWASGGSNGWNGGSNGGSNGWNGGGSGSPTAPTNPTNPGTTSAPSSTPSTSSCPLRTAGHFAVLGGSTVTNTGPTTIDGDLGLSPGTSIPGRAQITLNGAINVADAVAAQAQRDLTTAFGALSAAACDASPAAELGGQTFLPGVYCLSSSAQLTGAVTLNGGGQYIFRIPSALTTASSARVILQNGASACNVFFLVGSSATIGGSNTFNGNILAQTSITSVGSDVITGSLLASTGAVTLNTDTISSSTCGCP